MEGPDTGHGIEAAEKFRESVQPRISCEWKAAGEKRGGIVQLERQIRLPV